ncbi:MAG: hypothetical protein MK171_07235 [Pirellulales bacterium]|nr:hypothetical protein [Pirellulales bacterium]
MASKNCFILLFLWCLSFPNGSVADPLDSGFVSPPDSTKPWVYWYWMNGQVSKEGITKDLEAMSHVGIGEAFIGHIGETNEKSTVETLSDNWWQHVDHAIREGNRLGVDIGLFNGPGWSQSGGPWTKPEDSMKYVVSTEQRVNGPMRFSDKLPAHKDMIKDVAVIAFPVPQGEDDFIESHKPEIDFTAQKEELVKLVDIGNGNLTRSGVDEESIPDITRANWIWYPEGDPKTYVPECMRYFRRVFTIDGEIHRAYLSITADDEQKVWINGSLMEEGGSENWQNINTYPIGKFLRQGENVIAVQVENKIGWSWSAGLIATAKIVIADGREIILQTDSNWKTSNTEQADWKKVAFSDDSWQRAKEVAPCGEGPWGDFKDKLNSACVIEWKLEQPYTARSLAFHFEGYVHLDIQGRLKMLDEDGIVRTIENFYYSGLKAGAPSQTALDGVKPILHSFAPATSKHFRLEMDSARGISKIKLVKSAKVENASDKQLAILHPAPWPSWDSYLWPAPEAGNDTETAIASAAVKDISKFLDDEGNLTWDVPEGQWIIQRIGMAPTGAKNTPAAKEATGLECDKMSKVAIKKHFDAMVGKTLSRIPENERTALKHVIVDSYEVGAQNWTDGFETTFKKRLGYDPYPWLPVLDGRVVGSPDESERFLWDLRRLVADLISENYVGELKEISNRNGLRVWLENYGHWGYPCESLQYGGASDDVGGEFWMSTLGPIEVRIAASCAHTYGKKVVYAEAFTCGPTNLSVIKARGDWAFTEGVNHFALHLYTHQPEDLPAPGLTSFGASFHRNNPVFDNMHSWVKYLQRCHYMLQQGHHVADVAYFLGEDSPKMSGAQQPPLPAGYNYDYINGEVIRDHMTIRNGRWTLPDGMSYRILALPPLATMRPELLQKIGDLVQKGGVLMGAPPRQSPSLQGYPACDTTVTALAEQIWGDCDGVKVKQRKFGEGVVFNGVDLRSALGTLKTEPDIVIEQPGILWTHRTDQNSDIYFISSQNAQAVLAEMSFRVGGRAPEVWDPASGEIIRTARFEQDGGRTRLTLPLDGFESLFVIFRQPFKGAPVEKVLLGEKELDPSEVIVSRDARGRLEARIDQAGSYDVQFKNGRRTRFEIETMPEPVSIDGAWEVTFPLDRGSIVEKFRSLIPWSQHENEKIKAFSGTATYQKTFSFPKDYFKGECRTTLLLGNVGAMAGVTINGKQLETLWKPPFEFDITGLAKPGDNVLEISVTNAHGDTASGLIGPVIVSSGSVVKLTE